MQLPSKHLLSFCKSRRFILVFIYCLPSLPAISQKKTTQASFSDTAFIFNILPEIKDGKIVLLDKLRPHTLKYIYSHLQEGTLVEQPSPRNNFVRLDSITLAAAEKKYINKKVHALHKNKWRKDFPANFHIISRDTINKIFSDKNLSWKHFNSVYGERFYSFSKPIFLKESNLCIFYYEYSCGILCAYGMLAIYKRDPSGWRLLFVLNEWVS